MEIADRNRHLHNIIEYKYGTDEKGRKMGVSVVKLTLETQMRDHKSCTMHCFDTRLWHYS